jgi:cytochrome c-type biogenesis protein CcmH
MTLDDAVKRIEAQLEKTPDDLRGWRAIAPAYMQLDRFDDAARAYRKILALAPPTADGEVDLAEALMMAGDGAIAGEPADLLRSALGRDPKHVRARFYLAGEATRTGRFTEAVALWDALIADASGDEPWLAPAREGRGAALAGRDGGTPAAPDIAAMVEGLAARLEAEGGTIAEWTQLVRSRLVLGETEKAGAAYRAARLAYPDAGDRQALDVLAADHGLIAAKGAP